MRTGNYVRKPVIAIDYKTNKRLKIFDSVKDASNELGLDRASVHRCLSGEYNHTHGYTFMYV